MQANLYSEHLIAAGIKPTASRILVLRALVEGGEPLSLIELETMLATVDRSQISRALSLFMEHDLLHRIEGPDGIARYEVCHCSHEENNDLHVHFFCERCGHLTCLNEVSIPAIGIPEGYVAHSVSYIISGLCPECSKKKV